MCDIPKEIFTEILSYLWDEMYECLNIMENLKIDISEVFVSQMRGLMTINNLLLNTYLTRFSMDRVSTLLKNIRNIEGKCNGNINSWALLEICSMIDLSNVVSISYDMMDNRLSKYQKISVKSLKSLTLKRCDSSLVKNILSDATHLTFLDISDCIFTIENFKEILTLTPHLKTLYVPRNIWGTKILDISYLIPELEFLSMVGCYNVYEVLPHIVSEFPQLKKVWYGLSPIPISHDIINGIIGVRTYNKKSIDKEHQLAEISELPPDSDR